MKKAVLSFTLMGVITIALIASCSKNYNSKGTGTQSLNQLFAGLRSAPQGLSVTAGRDTIVYGAQGTMLHFYTNSFKDASGNIITSGTVYLQLVEMYKVGDFIANRTSTVANDSLLTSGAEINLIANMNGVEVYPNKYGVGFKQSAASSQSMQLYYGNNNTADSVTNWTVGNNTTPGTTANGTTTDTFRGYNYIYDSCSFFHTVNCDFFWAVPGIHPVTDINVIVPDASYDNTNTQIFITFPVYMVAVPISAYNSTNNTFSLNYHGTTLPVGLDYKVVAMANKNGNWYYFEQSGTTTAGMTINVAMAPDSEGDVKTRMAGL